MRRLRSGRSGDRLLRALGSVRFVVPLLFVLAVLAVVGTVVPQGQGEEEAVRRFGPAVGSVVRRLGIDDWYRGPLFGAVLALLGLSTAACLANRGGLHWRLATERGPGFRERLHSWSFLVLHAGLLFVLSAGAVVSWNSRTVTANIYVGDASNRFFDPRLRREVELPFSVMVEEAWHDYYPARLQFGIRRADGTMLGVRETSVGRLLRLPELDLGILALELDPEAMTLDLKVSRGGVTESHHLAFREEADNSVRASDVEVVFLAWRRDLRMIRSRIRLVRGGREAAAGEISVNHPLVYRGYRVYQRELGVDRFGNPFSGYQVVKAPGMPLVWGSLLLLLLGLGGAASARWRFERPVPAGREEGRMEP